MEVHGDKNKIRRKENKALPPLNTERKRDAKAQSKGAAQAANPETD